MAHPFPFKKWTVVTIIATGEEAVALADERFGVVAVKTTSVDVLLVRHDDLAPTRKFRSAASYDTTSIAS